MLNSNELISLIERNMDQTQTIQRKRRNQAIVHLADAEYTMLINIANERQLSVSATLRTMLREQLSVK